MELIKERNFVIARDGEILLGKWNISTGDFYGKSGVIVRSKPRCFTANSISGAECENLAVKRCLQYFLDYFGFSHDWYDEASARGLEEFMSVGITPRCRQDLLHHEKLTKDLVAYLKEENDGVYDEQSVHQYNSYKKYGSMLDGKSTWFKTAFMTLTRESGYNLPTQYVSVALARCESEHVTGVFESLGLEHRIYDVLDRYYRYCMEMWNEVKVERNFLTNISCVFYTYANWQKQNMAKNIHDFNNVPALSFTFGEYVARPLLTPEAFHDEAEQQGNCVERLYMDRVARRQTHIVQIRKINNLDKSVVTCEVDVNGNIRQYLKRFNNWLRIGQDNDLIDFKEAYQKHLSDNWGQDA